MAGILPGLFAIASAPCASSRHRCIYDHPIFIFIGDGADLKRVDPNCVNPRPRNTTRQASTQGRVGPNPPGGPLAGSFTKEVTAPQEPPGMVVAEEDGMEVDRQSSMLEGVGAHRTRTRP